MDRETTLELLERYGSEAFNDVPARSTMRGKEFCGYLYSPYFFRRYIGHQFENLVSVWGASDRKDSVVDWIACGVKTEEVAFTQAETVEDAMKAEAEEICRKFGFSWKTVLSLKSKNVLIKANVIRMVCKCKGLKLTEAEKLCECLLAEEIGCEEFAEAVKAEDVDHHSVKRMAKMILDNFAVVGKSDSTVTRCEFGQSILRGRELIFVERDDRLVTLYKKLVQEITTLAVLEQHNDEIFKERKQFLPLSLVNSIFGKEWKNYKEAAEELPSDVWDRDLEFFRELDQETMEEYRFKYVLAGYFYWKRNKIAFGGSGSTEEFEQARNEIPTWDRKKLEEEIKKLADELATAKVDGVDEIPDNGKLKRINVF